MKTQPRRWLDTLLDLFHWDPEPVYRFGARWLTRLIWRPRYIGFEKIPAEGPVVLIANHISYIDGLLIQAGCNRPVRYVIDEIIYRQPVVKYFMDHNRAIPILPKRESVEKAFDIISEGLKAGDAICIFPEGQLTYTGHLGRFRPGIEHIINRDPVPVYPIAIKGVWGSVFSRKYIKSKYPWFPRHWKKPLTLICGNPIPPEEVNVNTLQQVVLKLKMSGEG